jgi:hypothetical protein
VVFPGNPDSQAVPAQGAQFAAIQYRFTCLQALCETPPGVGLSLRLKDGSTILYSSGSQPVLNEKPGLSRLSKGQSDDGWVVFEVPVNASLDALLITPGDQKPGQDINLFSQ